MPAILLVLAQVVPLIIKGIPAAIDAYREIGDLIVNARDEGREITVEELSDIMIRNNLRTDKVLAALDEATNRPPD